MAGNPGGGGINWEGGGGGTNPVGGGGTGIEDIGYGNVEGGNCGGGSSATWGA